MNAFVSFIFFILVFVLLYKFIFYVFENHIAKFISNLRKNAKKNRNDKDKTKNDVYDGTEYDKPENENLENENQENENHEGLNEGLNEGLSQLPSASQTTKETHEGFKEGIKFPKIPSPGDIQKKMKGDFDKVGNIAKDGIKKAKERFDQIGNTFKKVGDIFKKFGRGLQRIFIGIGQEFTGIGDGLELGFRDIRELFVYFGEFIFTYINCGIKTMKNLHECILYYAIDTVLSIFYVPVRLNLWFLNAFLGMNLYPLEKSIWNFIYKIDGMCFRSLGFHFAKWPSTIRNNCYNCKRLKISAMKRMAQKVDYDFKYEMPKKLMRGVNTMRDGAEDIKGAFKM